ncbi:MAG TPA: hypothetical protein ENJ09_16015 [Planctomycetes bacterium]|nr:hypothetical protein [Planctomycetota bacterium]
MASAIPLVMFGGSVTTIGAGMAVDGWLIAEGHFMVFFPIESWLRDTATFVEHTHRLFGVLVGLFAIATVVSTFLKDPRRRARLFATLGLLAVCVQGTVGGFRVLENSPRLAFLHGALAQAVFAILVSSAVYLSPRWGGERQSRAGVTRGLRSLAGWTVVAVYGQVVLGAWYRHAIRPSTTPEATMRFLLHLFGALAVTTLVFLLARSLGRLGREGNRAAARKAHALLILLGVQITLGVGALVGYRSGTVGPIEWGLAICHVLGGGLLLGEAAVVRLWAATGAAGVEPDPAAGERGASGGRPSHLGGTA